MRLAWLLSLGLLVSPVLGAPLAAAAPIDACHLLTRAEVQSIVGEPFSAGRRSVAERGAETVGGDVSACSFDTGPARGQPPRTVSIWIRSAPEGRNDSFSVLAEQRRRLEQEHAAIEPAANVGDEAFAETGELLGSREVRLHARQGREVVMITVGGVADERAALDEARALAAKVLARLPTE